MIAAALGMAFVLLNGAPAAQVKADNYADDFLAFWESTASLSTADRVKAFKTQVAVLQPSFYGVARYDGRVTEEQHDAAIAKAIDGFAAIRPEYVAEVKTFDTDLNRNIATFKKAFPDFEPNIHIYLLHSLGEMDGGTRDLDGGPALIFGADVMARIHKGWHNESAFFHHELFHVYHKAYLGKCEAIWCGLWMEGLAIHVSEVLNPDATNAELLLDRPLGLVPRTQQALTASLEDLAKALDSEDDDVYADLFNGGPEKTALPRRRGYYLGLLVAREISKTHSIQSLAKMSASEARPLVVKAVNDLLIEARKSSQPG